MLKRRGQEQNTGNRAEYENLEAGEYEGRLAYVGDLGLQAREFRGEEKPPCQQISLGIELVDSTVVIDGNEQPRLMWTRPINIFHTLNEKGKELEYYKVFDSSAKEGQVADWDSVISEPCSVNVVHGTSKADPSAKYDNIGSVTPIPAKYKDGVSAMRISDACVGDADDLDNPATKALFGLARHVFDKRLDEVVAQTPAQPARPAPADNFDDEVPF